MKTFLILTLTFQFFSISFSQQSDEMYKRAIENYKLGNVNQADSLITLSILYDGVVKDYLKYYNRGVFRQDLNLIDSSILDFKRALSINDKFYPAWENLAFSYYLNDSLLNAFEAIEIGLLKQPNQTEGYLFAANYLFKLHEMSLCIKFCDEGLKYKNDIRLFSYKSLAYTSLGQYKSSESMIKEMSNLSNSKNQYYYDALIFLKNAKKSTDFCNLTKEYFFKFGKECMPLFGMNECYQNMLQCEK